MARHDELLRSELEGHGGYVFSTGGDGFAVAFARVGDAIAAAVSAQRALVGAVWPGEATIGVRMGLHTGEADERQGDYFGSAVNRAARLMALAHGGQVVASDCGATVTFAGPGDATCQAYGLGMYLTESGQVGRYPSKGWQPGGIQGRPRGRDLP
jgi:class 3 adenylate cyclase